VTECLINSEFSTRRRQPAKVLATEWATVAADTQWVRTDLAVSCATEWTYGEFGAVSLNIEASVVSISCCLWLISHNMKDNIYFLR